MSDITWIVIAFLLGTSFGLALAEVIAYVNYRVRYSPKKKKKQDAVQPLLGVVLPSEEKK